nr:hypothetical protein [Tanacetum cinerariifolium]
THTNQLADIFTKPLDELTFKRLIAELDTDSLENEPIIVTDESEEEEAERYKDTHATSHNEPEDTSLEQQKEKAKAEAEVAFLKAQPFYLPTELKELPSKITELSGEDKVAELKTLQWKLPAEFLVLPSQVSSVQEKLKTLDTLPSPLNKKLKKFNFITKKGKQIHCTAEKIKEQKRIEESIKADLDKQEVEKVKNELVDLMGIDVLTKYYKNKLLELVQACPDNKEKGWKTIYGLIKTRIDYLHQTEYELKIEFNKPLNDQDPLDKLNDLANKKKRKREDDLHDYTTTKKFKSLAQHEEEAICIFKYREIVGVSS